MKELLEKLKALDKKVWIIAGAVAIAVIAVVITLVLVLGGSGDTPENTETQGSTAVTTTTKATTTTAKATTTTTKKTTTTTKATTTTTKATTTQNTVVVTDAPTTAVTQPTNAPTTAATQPTATNPEGEEILGAGSKAEPYLETPTEDMTVKTVEIPAGKSLYYDIYRVGGMILTIDSSNAYVVCDGVRHDASGGSVSFEVPSALASDAVSFEIGNNGSSAASFTLRFSNQTGSYMNPVAVSSITSSYKISLAEGTAAGYYYIYTAEKSGKLRLYMSASVDSVMLATNNRNSSQRTTEDDALSDANGTYIELEVQAGDEIIINVGAKPNKRGKYPATEITWSGKYA